MASSDGCRWHFVTTPKRQVVGPSRLVVTHIWNCTNDLCSLSHFQFIWALGKDLCPRMTHPQLSKADSLHHTLPKKSCTDTTTGLIRQGCKYWELSAHSRGYKFWRILISEWKFNHTTANTLNRFPQDERDSFCSCSMKCLQISKSE